MVLNLTTSKTTKAVALFEYIPTNKEIRLLMHSVWHLDLRVTNYFLLFFRALSGTKDLNSEELTVIPTNRPKWVLTIVDLREAKFFKEFTMDPERSYKSNDGYDKKEAQIWIIFVHWD